MQGGKGPLTSGILDSDWSETEFCGQKFLYNDP